MSSSSQGPSARPLKPWERAGGGSSAFPPDSGTTSTAAAVAAAGTANSDVKPEDAIPSRAGQPVAGKPMPPRPWERPSVGELLCLLFVTPLRFLGSGAV